MDNPIETTVVTTIPKGQTEMSMPDCDVCGGDAVEVVCSSLGAMSFAYCTKCLRNYAEPKGIVDLMDKEVDSNWKDSYLDSISVYIDGEYVLLREYINNG